MLAVLSTLLVVERDADVERHIEPVEGGPPVDAALVRAVRARLALFRGDLRAAEAAAREVLAVAEDAGLEHVRRVTLPTLVVILVERGERAAAEAELATAERELQAGPSEAPPLHALTPTAEMVAALEAYAPDVLMGYSGVLGLLAEEQLCGRLRIAPELVMGVSEPLTADIRARVREAWSVEPANVYASTEALVVAASCPATPGVLEIPDDMVIVEVVDAENRPEARERPARRCC